MIWIFLAALAVTSLALAFSLAILGRTRDLRVALLSGVFIALGVGQGVLAARSVGDPIAWGASLAVGLAGLAASMLGVLAVRLLGRTLADLDRSEALHWSSMEGVRSLAELSSERGLSPEERVSRLLEIGSRCFALEVGIVSRVHGPRYEITSLRAPESFPITRGAAFPLADTCCRRACESERPVAIHPGGKGNRRNEGSHRSEGGGDSLRSALPFEAYLGVALREAGQVVGTLAFGSLEPRRDPFTASEKDLLLLMARWLEMEREERRLAAPEPPRKTTTPMDEAIAPMAESPAPRDPSLHSPDETPAPRAADTTADGPVEAPWAGLRPARHRAIDLNALASRTAEKLASTAPENVRLHLDLAEDLAPARDLRLPLEAIVKSLVEHAMQGLSDGGEIFIETRNLEAKHGAGVDGVVPSHAPDRYVTLAVHDTGAGSDVESFTSLFDDTQESDETGAGARRSPLRLSAVYRMLQRCGGDLSAEVEPGHGTSLTVFLPREETREETQREREEARERRPAADAGPHSDEISTR